MDGCRLKRFHPHLEPLEAKRPLSAGAATLGFATPAGGSKIATAHAVTTSNAAADTPTNATVTALSADRKPNFGFLVYRITNPNPYNDKLKLPFVHVLVQTQQPIPGQVYNILQIAVRNGTAQTFDANSNFEVRFPGNPTIYPILTGTQTWQPGQEFVFYVLTKKYYPLPSVVHSGFDFSLAGARSVGIPGPSGIFLRLKYNPATFDSTLDKIVAFGPGAQGGKGIKLGLPDTAIYEFLSSKTNRLDFSGYF